MNVCAAVSRPPGRRQLFGHSWGAGLCDWNTSGMGVEVRRRAWYEFYGCARGPTKTLPATDTGWMQGSPNYQKLSNHAWGVRKKQVFLIRRKRDIVDRSTHASCSCEHVGTFRLYNPYTWGERTVRVKVKHNDRFNLLACFY